MYLEYQQYLQTFLPNLFTLNDTHITINFKDTIYYTNSILIILDEEKKRNISPIKYENTTRRRTKKKIESNKQMEVADL